MASLQAKTASQLGAVRGSGRVARFRPFVQVPRSAVRPAKQAASHQVVVRAAEAAAEAPADDFEFNLSDAKRGNEFSEADVEAALAYYAGEGGSATDYEAEHVVNEFGEGGFEDASFFDDIDNNEAYDDEFIAAGIPEAAPKQRRGKAKDEDGEEGEDDDIAAAKQASQLREIEEQMVLEAELQETGLDQVSSGAAASVGPAVWDWMSDVAVDEDDEALLASMARNPARISAQVADMLPSDEQVFADMRTANLQDVDAETKETIEFLLNDFDIDAELKAIPDEDDDEELPAVADVDIKAIDELLEADLSAPEIDAELLSLADLPNIVDDGLDLDEEVVSKYVESLNAVQGGKLDDAEVKALLADGAAKLVVAEEAPITVDDADLQIPEFPAMPEFVMPQIEDDLEEVDDVSDFIAEQKSLIAMPEPSFELPSAEEIEVLDQYLTAGEQFLASEEQRKMAVAQAVARGELPADALEEEMEEYVDNESELLNQLGDVEDNDADVAGEDDGENWQERIIELSRVTKVVKGGKLMGFRCVAIIGNGKGLVGVGCQSGREVATAVKRALVDAKKSVVRVPLVGAGTIPHRVEAKFHAARCVVVPAADGTGCLAGGSIRSVLELAGVQNVLAKRIGCRSALNNARCTVAALEQLRTLQDVAKSRGVPMEKLLLPQ